MTPFIRDNERNEITALIDGREIRGWSYASEAERRQKMLMAREFAEGWFQAINADPKFVKPGEETTAERLGGVTT